MHALGLTLQIAPHRDNINAYGADEARPAALIVNYAIYFFLALRSIAGARLAAIVVLEL